MTIEIFTEAWAEAEASNPPSVLIYQTLELIHPAFVDEITGPFSVRVVNGVADDMEFTLEDGAPLDGGLSVTFKAIAFGSEQPEWAEGRTPSTTIIVDNVGAEIMPYLETAVGSRSNLTAIWRQYRSDDLSEPCYGPIIFLVRKVTASKTRLQGLATLENMANKKFPNKLFTFEEFPGLINA